MDVTAIDKIILDDKRLKKFLIEGLKDGDRPLFYKRCIQIRHQQTINGSTSVSSIKPLDLTQYDTYCTSLFGHLQPSTNLPCVPDFGSPVQFPHADDLKPLPAINQTQQSILCLIKEAHPNLSHCPYLADLITLFARWFDDETIFSLLNLMMTAKQSNNQSNNESFYFTMNSGTFLTFVKKFYLLLKQTNESIKHHLKHMGIDISTVFQSWTERCYNGYHPVSTVIRFLDGFVAFGLPFLWAWSLALIDLNRKMISACSNPNQVGLLFFGDMRECDADEVLECSINMLSKVIKNSEKLKAKDIDRYVLNSVPLPRESSNHVPRLRDNQTSEILSHDQFCAIWCWIDDSLKVTDPKLLYASSLHGYSLATMLEKCTTDDPNVPHSPTITVVKTSTGAIFGVYLSNSWVKDSDAGQLRQASQLARFNMNEIETKIENERLHSRLHHADGRSFVFMLSPLSRCFRQPQARAERAKKQRALDNEEAERRVLRAGREGLRSRSSRTGTSSAAQHAVEDPMTDRSFEEVSILESSQTNPVPVRVPLSPVGQTAERGTLAAQLLRLMEAQRDELDEKSVNMMCSRELIALGDSLGVAFSLDQHLKKGVTQSTAVFDNDGLAQSPARDGSFDCRAVEVWGFRAPHE